MDLRVEKGRLLVIPAEPYYVNGSARALDEAFIENVLGLEKDGDSIRLVRVNVVGLLALAYLEAKKED